MICTGRLKFSCWKPARRLAWRCSSACTARLSVGLIELPLQVQLQLRRVDVRPLRRIQRMKQKTFLQRRQRQDVLDRA